ncbi:MAG: TIGR04190 family B12-binding domain/radical SAM domain protein [Thermoplasmata archaeon]
MRFDVVLMHPPSIYDFRKRDIVAGPISELVPSTGVFEMYPIGFLAMLSYLNTRGYKARIDNIALKMLNSKRYSFDEEILKMDTEYIGIDLHWLPHVHGALNLARIIKEVRPDIKVMLGGFSATYYATEIMSKIKDVDLVIRGDTTEKPMEMVISGKNMEEIPNTIYRFDGKIKDNGFTYTPDMDYQEFDYSQIIKSSIKTMDISGHLPYCDWLREPVAMVLSTHGCSFSCGICGGSYFAFKNFYHRNGPIYRSSKKIVEDIMRINDDLKIPVFIAGDLLMRSDKEIDYIFDNLRKEGMDVPLLMEVFVPHPRERIQKLMKATSDVSMEISPDSSNDKIRFKNGRSYKNRELERFISDFLDIGGKKIDVYFMVGLSGQTREDVLDDVKYSKHLMESNKNDKRIFIFTSPLSPFLDPGSKSFETPSQGYKLRFKTLLEHYDALDKGRTWEDYLNYETNWMDRKTIVETTYDAIDMLLKEKEELGYIEKEEYEKSHHVLETSRLAVNLSRAGDYGMLSKGEALIRNCSGKYTVLKKEIMWGSSSTREKKLIFMMYRYLHSSRK